MNQPRNLASVLLCLAALAAPVAAQAAGDRLPAGYTEIEYIQGPGNGRFVTDYTPAPNTDKIEAVVEWPANTIAANVNQAVWCARGNGTQADSWTLFDLGTQFRFDYMPNGHAVSLTPSFTISTGTKYTITAEDNTVTYSANGSTLLSQDTPAYSYTAGSVLALFASHYSGINANVGNYGKHKLYSFKVWRSGELIHYFVPCKDSGGAATLVDICDNPAMLTRSGTFTAGGEGHYFDDSLFTMPADTLVISGSAGNVGSPSPAYGKRTGLAAGATVLVSCGDTPVITAAGKAYACTGWKLYDWDGDVVSNGTGTAFAYTHPTPAEYRNLEWQWTDLLTILPIPDQINETFDPCRPELTVSNTVNGTTWTIGGNLSSQFFDVAYTNNFGANVAMATVTGKGDFDGVILRQAFNISATKLEDENIYTTDVTARRREAAGKYAYIFTNAAAAQVATVKRQLLFTDYLVVGGGGGGGNTSGGGGGGGGVTNAIGLVGKCLVADDAFTVSVGAGGAGASVYTGKGANGKATTLRIGDTFVSVAGGGGGGSWFTAAGVAGGTGGGGTQSGAGGAGTDGIGHAGAAGSGASASGGGGGAGHEGYLADATATRAGNGGEGILSSITGEAIYYGGGGGGGGSSGGNGNYLPGFGGPGGGGDGERSIPGHPGIDGLGGGGGGGGWTGGQQRGGNGGSGTVILAFKPSDFNIDPIPPQTLAAGGARPDPVVRPAGGSTVLTKDVDYEVAYTDNTALGTALVTVTGIGDYAGRTGYATFLVVERYYAKPVVAVEGDGTSWATAMSVANLFATLGTTTAPCEVWIAAGTVPAAAASLTNNADLVIRGGFAGTETTLAERQPGALTIFDGENTVPCPLKVQTGENAELTLDGFKFYRAKENGFIKTGAGSLRVLNCVVEGNGKDVDRIYGRGMNVQGGGAGSLVVSNCVFKGNVRRSGIYTYGGFGIYVNSFGTALVDDSLFVTNGYALAAPGAGGNCGADGGYGSAMRVIDTPVTVRRCRFAGNVTPLWTSGDSGGVLMLNGACGGSVIDHCVFIGNTDRASGQARGDINTGGALAVKLSSATAKVKVQNCTFAYNIAHGHYSAGGISVATGDVDIDNSVFWKNTRARVTTVGYGSDVQVSSGSKASIRNSLVTTLDGTALAGAGLTIDESSVFAADARLVTTTEAFTNLLTVTASSIYYNPSKSGIYESLAAMDAHLLSPAGYVVNGGAAGPATTDYSLAIDFGDPAADCSNEPAPNGGRLNAGAFGNTAEASRTAYGQPKATVEVLYPDGTPQPLVKITMGLESGDAYSATVRIVCSTNGVTLADETFSFIGNGQVVEYQLPAYLPLGTAFTAAVTVNAPEAETRCYDVTETVTGAYPPWYGKKGPDNVIHVRQDASGRNDGTSWTDAFTSWADALNAVSAEKNEIWVAGTNLMSEAIATKAFTYPAAVRGGFRGWEESAAERPVGLRSVVDGRNLFDTFNFSNTDDVLVESIEFLRGGYRGLKKTASAGNVTISNCVFYGCTKGKGNWDGNGNSNVSYQYGGGGAGLYGSGGAKATVVDCRFEANIINSAGGNGGFGGGLYVGSFGGGAEIYRCSFVTNYMQRGFDSSAASMAALHVYNTPATIDRCSFYGHYATGTADVNGNCSGSVFRRCSFVGNYGGSAGILKVSLSNTNNTTRVENCTFAYNIAPALNCTKGAVAVTNCIFYGNLANVNATAAADIRVAADATATVDYCLFAVPESDGSTICVSETTAGTLQIGSNCIYGDPLFVTPTNTVMSHVKSPAGATMPRVLPSNFSWSWSKPVPTFEQAMGYDVHLRSYIGTWDNSGQLRKFLKELSPAIDAGDKRSDHSLEPVVHGIGGNGGRVNLGAYGNTPEASLSPFRGTVLIVR